MAITDYKITDGEITDNMVESAPDVLSDTPTNNKKIFDQLVKVFIAKYNDLIDNINSDFVDSSEFAEGLTVSDKVRWRYALTKGTSIGLNFSGNITQITTGFRTIVGDIDGLTETDFMDCYLSINGTDYECGDSYASGNSILTSAVINGVTVEIIYDTTNGNITLEHATNPLDTLYWNVSIYRSVAEKVPRKALPASVSNDGYTELSNKETGLAERVSAIENTPTTMTSLYDIGTSIANKINKGTTAGTYVSLVSVALSDLKPYLSHENDLGMIIKTSHTLGRIVSELKIVVPLRLNGSDQVVFGGSTVLDGDTQTNMNIASTSLEHRHGVFESEDRLYEYGAIVFDSVDDIMTVKWLIGSGSAIGVRQLLDSNGMTFTKMTAFATPSGTTGGMNIDILIGDVKFIKAL